MFDSKYKGGSRVKSIRNVAYIVDYDICFIIVHSAKNTLLLMIVKSGLDYKELIVILRKCIQSVHIIVEKSFQAVFSSLVQPNS